MYKTEFILRHWQYTYNEYWDKAEAEYPDRPKLPCTVEGLREALRRVGRHDLLRKLGDIPSIPEEEYEPLVDITTPKEILERRSCEQRPYEALAFAAEDSHSQDEVGQILLKSSVTSMEIFV